MNKLIIWCMLCASLLIAACASDTEPEGAALHFEKESYALLRYKTYSIPFTGGCGEYRLTASDADVLGKFYMDNDSKILVVTPSGTGESTLTVEDVKTNNEIALNFTVDNFCLSYRIDRIDGYNDNPYLGEGDEIRFIRDDANTRQLRIMRLDKTKLDVSSIADGHFDIVRSDEFAYIMNLTLHSLDDDEFGMFEYSITGDGMCIDAFKHYFGFDWGSEGSSKSQPIRPITMILTASNGCRIVCTYSNVPPAY